MEYLEKLYQVTKIIAESDSVGEGWAYCEDYTREQFKKELIEYENNAAYSYVYVANEVFELLKIKE